MMCPKKVSDGEQTTPFFAARLAGSFFSVFNDDAALGMAVLGLTR